MTSKLKMVSAIAMLLKEFHLIVNVQISMKSKTKVEELDATLVLMQKQSASDGVSAFVLRHLAESEPFSNWIYAEMKP